jgi:hypothetical protein
VRWPVISFSGHLFFYPKKDPRHHAAGLPVLNLRQLLLNRIQKKGVDLNDAPALLAGLINI